MIAGWRQSWLLASGLVMNGGKELFEMRHQIAVGQVCMSLTSDPCTLALILPAECFFKRAISGSVSVLS